MGGLQSLDVALKLEDELGLGEPGVLGVGLALEGVVSAGVVLGLEELHGLGGPGELKGEALAWPR